MKRDAAFGPVVAFGLGGMLTEVFRDVALAVAPARRGRCRRAPRPDPGKALLGAFRGQPAVDRAALVDDHPGRRADRRRPPADRRDRREPAAHPGRPAGGRRRADHPLGRALPQPPPSAVVHARPRAPCWRRGPWPSSAPPATSPVGRLGPAHHPRRRLRGRHLSGQPQGRRVLRPPVVHEPRRAARSARPGPAGRGRRSRSRPCSSSAARKGITAAVAIAAGFSETGDGGRRGRARARPHRRPRAASPSSAPTAWASSPTRRSLHAVGLHRPAPAPRAR